jgi:hypothetical protein
MDLNNIVFSVVGIQLKKDPNVNKKFENFVRFMTLNCIRSWKSKFPEYGELVLCDDCEGDSWRKKAFKQYKAARKIKRKASKIDWDKVFQVTNGIKEEIKTNFPYRYVKVSGAEADDVIAVIAQNQHKHKKEVLIISGDKDFKQIHSKYIKQYSPVQKQWIECEDPKQYLAEHILSGDIADGIPNFLSDDDTFIIEGKRQTPLRKKLVEEHIGGKNLTDDMEKKYKRNQKLIDFSFIPNTIESKIIDESKRPYRGKMANVRKYLKKHDLQQLIKNIKDF